jgi:hypothetical protein
MATNPNPGIGPTGPRDDEAKPVTTGSAAAQPKMEEPLSAEKVETQPIREIGPVGPRKKA